jgi:molecular chaperone GrpE
MIKQEDPKDEEIRDEEEAEIVIDETDEENYTDKIKKLQQKLKACSEEKQEYLEGWQRAKADYVNFKRETEDQRKEIIKYAQHDLLFDLIQVVDSFDLAFAHKDTWQSLPENWRQGVEYIHSQLLSVFKNYGLEEDNPLGQKFNPEKHESVGVIDTKKKEEENIILEVVKKGYILNGKAIRPAGVKVGTLKGQPEN